MFQDQLSLHAGQWEHFAILSAFIKLRSLLSIFEWPSYTGYLIKTAREIIAACNLQRGVHNVNMNGIITYYVFNYSQMFSVPHFSQNKKHFMSWNL